ncbi:MAG: prolyl oligopeptidase family serine peptidase [Thermomicrobiales bacterium]
MSSQQSPAPLTIDQIIALKTPEEPAWSPDGSQIAYRLAGFEHGEIWLSELNAEPRQLTSGAQPAGPPVWDGNNVHIVFPRGRDVCRVTANGGDEETILTLPEGASRITVLPSADAVVYVLDGDAWLWSWHDHTPAAEPVRMTEGEWLMTRLVHRITDVFFPSPDGLHIAIACPQEHSLNLAVFSRVDDTLHWIMPGDDIVTAAVWSSDGKRLAFTRYGWRVKWRELWACKPTGENPVRIWRDENKHWVSRFQFDAAFSPQGNYIAFVAPIDNFGQVLVGHADGSNDPLQVSEPDAEAEQPRWSPDKDWISYLSNQGRQKRLHLVNALHREERHDPIRQPGSISSYAWSPTSDRIVTTISNHDRPDYLATIRTETSQPQVISSDHHALQAQVQNVNVSITTIPSDGEEWQVPVLMMRRKDLPNDHSAPGVIYIHGGGQGQYAVPAWQGYSGAGTTYAANLMLAQMGYVVLIVDYRGSWNYGRDYETASYLDVGGGDLWDVLEATRWLGKQSQVNANRIGVWGRSYGGFMTTLCMVKEPALYSAGVNLVGVFNWVDYYHYLSDRAPGTWSRSRFRLPTSTRISTGTQPARIHRQTPGALSRALRR